MVNNLENAAAQPAPLAAGGSVSVIVPLQLTQTTDTTIPYQISTTNRGLQFRFSSEPGNQQTDSLTLSPPSGSSEQAPAIPQVRLWVDQYSNVIGPAGRPVKIHWELDPDLTGTLWDLCPVEWTK